MLLNIQIFWLRIPNSQNFLAKTMPLIQHNILLLYYTSTGVLVLYSPLWKLTNLCALNFLNKDKRDAFFTTSSTPQGRTAYFIIPICISNQPPKLTNLSLKPLCTTSQEKYCALKNEWMNEIGEISQHSTLFSSRGGGGGSTMGESYPNSVSNPGQKIGFVFSLSIYWHTKKRIPFRLWHNNSTQKLDPSGKTKRQEIVEMNSLEMNCMQNFPQERLRIFA